MEGAWAVDATACAAAGEARSNLSLPQMQRYYIKPPKSSPCGLKI